MGRFNRRCCGRIRRENVDFANRFHFFDFCHLIGVAKSFFFGMGFEDY